MEPRWKLTTRPSVVKRALKYAVIVGAILIAINHGDAILSGALTPVLVPYTVSTLSSVDATMQALRNNEPS